MPSLHGKGKIRPITMTKSQERFVNTFKNLANTDIDVTTVTVIEEFVCHVFDFKKQTNIHRVLAFHFEARCKPKRSGKPLDSIKNKDPKSFLHAKEFSFNKSKEHGSLQICTRQLVILLK